MSFALTTTQRYLPGPAVPHERWGTALSTLVVPNYESFSRVTIASSQVRAYFLWSG